MMGYISRFYHNVLKGKSPVVDPGQGGWQTVFGPDTQVDTGELWKDLTDSEREAVYKNFSVVMACVRELCNAFVEPPLQIGMEREDGFEPEDSGHPMLELLLYPNPEYSCSDLMQYYLARLLLTGKSYVWKFREGGGFVNELWPIPTSWVTPEKGQGDESRLFKYFKVNQGVGQADKRVAWSDMLYGRFVDPATTWDGVGPLHACARDYRLDMDRQDYLKEMLEHMNLPGLVITTDPEHGELSEPERRQLRAELDDQVGKGKRGQSIIIGRAKAEISAPLSDLDWPGFASLDETRICAAFGVPPIVIHLRSGLERSTYSNYEEARKSFYRETMVPLWRMADDTWSRALLQGEGETELVYRHDLSCIRELGEDEDKIAERATLLFEKGVITRNQALAMIGEDKTPDGDVYRLPVNVLEVPAGASGQDWTEAHDEDARDANAHDGDQAEADQRVATGDAR